MKDRPIGDYENAQRAYAQGEYTLPVQCGECYNWYDAADDSQCPQCGSEEIVGDR
jgi:predicted Zn-ribbon and HTH transcriptional regulator